MLDNEELKNRFTFHKATEDQAVRYESIRAICGELAQYLNEMCPPSRELSVSLTKLDEVVFWANASIARHEG